jgi:sec-independent protein translocase protein TatA
MGALSAGARADLSFLPTNQPRSGTCTPKDAGAVVLEADMFFRSPYADALIVVLILLLFFGPKRLPALGKSLGQGMREFKDSITGKSNDDEHPELTAASEAPAAAPPEREPATVAAPADQGTSEPRS